MKRLNPLNDYLVQKYLGEKGDEVQLMSLLNAILQKTQKKKIVSLEILENKVLTADTINEKKVILDVRAVLEDNTRVNLEVQVKNVGRMDIRSLFYFSRELSKCIDEGQEYDELPNVIVINILDYEFLPIDKVHAVFHLWEDEEKHKLTDVLEMHFIDMVKFRRLKEKDIERNVLHRWLTFFNKSATEEELKEVLVKELGIRKAQDKIDLVSRDKDAMRLYEARQIGIMDYNSGMSYARREGRTEGLAEGRTEGLAEGLAEGRNQAMLEVARKMLVNKIPVALIVETTGFDEGVVFALQKERPPSF